MSKERCAMSNELTATTLSARIRIFSLLVAHGLWLPFSAQASEPNPARLYYADADISVTFPNHWDLENSFPVGPMFSKITQSGSKAFISCALSEPMDPTHLRSDLPPDLLRQAVNADLASRIPDAKVLAGGARTLAAQNAYEVTWQKTEADGSYEYQSVYFFRENRIYSLTLRARAEDFLWLVPDFQGWLTHVQTLTRRDSASLADPAHGGLWIHQAGGAKVLVPDNWLIGVADDRHVGATIARGDQHSEMTATVDAGLAGTTPIGEDEKAADRRSIESQGFRVVSESEEPFHGCPALTLAYDGNRGGRFVKGEDLWVAGPRGRWLINIEGDGPLFNKLGDDYRDIMNNIQFL
ncbi:MAG TPA: hypothetical protein VMU17_03005 [Elusimicrobiota bacterium]|nr:hypothetical protein [Elusimicrobiota bacterium]